MSELLAIYPWRQSYSGVAIWWINWQNFNLKAICAAQSAVRVSSKKSVHHDSTSHDDNIIHDPALIRDRMGIWHEREPQPREPLRAHNAPDSKASYFDGFPLSGNDLELL